MRHVGHEVPTSSVVSWRFSFLITLSSSKDTPKKNAVIEKSAGGNLVLLTLRFGARNSIGLSSSSKKLLAAL